MTQNIRILSTKKLTQPQKDHLLQANLAVVEADFIEVKQATLQNIDLKNSIIITSKNGVKSVIKNQLLSNIQHKKVFCVGTKTAAFLKENGIEVTHEAKSGLALANYIIANYPNESFTYFCSNIRRHELHDLLEENNILLDEVIAYRTTVTPKKIKGNFDGILFFSPSLVESYTLSNTIGNAMAFCIGETTATTALAYTKNIITANQPTIENTIIQVIKYYKP
ncbi:uroporphyrinogen-III synthase [Zhouia sp. PK063]|uniref:uroporphyrinogen-III synthase n=1 Tax=Zhouia sp. PK063 TaxID=3373602 RepID=UPI0037A1B022